MNKSIYVLVIIAVLAYAYVNEQQVYEPAGRHPDGWLKHASQTYQ